MIYKLIAVDNKNSIGYQYIDRIGLLEIINGMFYFNDMRSSLVQTDTEKDGIRTIQTLNTKYVFMKDKFEIHTNN